MLLIYRDSSSLSHVSSLPVNYIINISATTSNLGNPFGMWVHHTRTDGMSKYYKRQSHSTIVFDRHIKLEPIVPFVPRMVHKKLIFGGGDPSSAQIELN